MPLYVLGIDMNDVSTSACLVRDGQLAAGAQEERFNREKKTRRFPVQAVDWCLKSAGLELEDLDAVAVPVNPAIYLETLNPSHYERARFRGELLYSPLNFLLGAYGGMAGGASRLEVQLDNGGTLEVHYIRHHDAHAASAFYLSPFDDAAVFTADAFGEKDCMAWYHADGNNIARIRATEFPYSAGCFYAAITEYLGFRPFRDEWKVMGAGAFGDADRYQAEMDQLIWVGEDGAVGMNLDYFRHHLFHRPGLFTEKLATLLGSPYKSGEETDERFFDIAAAAQQKLEQVIIDLLKSFRIESGKNNLCYAGGLAMNCALNGKIESETGFEKVFIPPLPDDSGTSAGAALAVSRLLDPGESVTPMIHNSIGPGYSDAEILETLDLAGVRYRRADDPAKEAARLIASGRIVAWFQDGMEFGERALGSRSILADPRDIEMKDRITDRVKFREPFRPFAPAVLVEHQSEWFESDEPVCFMEKTVKVREEMAGRIPAVVHEDGTARLQSVSEESNPLFHELIQEFHRLSGTPMVLNTSFNLRGEPIVMTPHDALRTFFSCGIHHLVIGSFVVGK